MALVHTYERYLRGSIALASAAAVLMGASPARAELRRVVVKKFDGPPASSNVARQEVLDIVDSHYELIPYERFRETGRRLGVQSYSSQTVAYVARNAGVDAIIEGRVTKQKRKRRLTLSVREGRTGRVVDSFHVPVRKRMTDSTRDQLSDELVDLLEWTEPLDVTANIGADPKAEPAWAERRVRDGYDGEVRSQVTRVTRTRAPCQRDDRACIAASARELGILETTRASKRADVGIEEEDDDEDEDEPSNKKAANSVSSGVSTRVAIGASATARRLRFLHQEGLSEDERPMELAGSPAAGAAVHGDVHIAAIGLGVTFSYERALGAQLAYRDGGAVRQLPVTQRQWHVGAIARTEVGRAILHVGAGYNEQRYAIAEKPGTLRIPDAQYSFVSVGGGVQLPLRNKRVALVGSAEYLHPMSTAGITDRAAYGSAQVQGYRGDLGIEILTSDSMYLRAGGRYMRLLLAFRGDGEWASNLDDDSTQDVMAAADNYVGGYVLLGFQF